MSETSIQGIDSGTADDIWQFCGTPDPDMSEKPCAFEASGG